MLAGVRRGGNRARRLWRLADAPFSLRHSRAKQPRQRRRGDPGIHAWESAATR